MYAGQRFNAFSHWLGLAMALGGAVVLLDAAKQQDTMTIAGILIFALASAFLYAASVACHSTRGKAQQLWLRLDHAATFVLIAGTYTAFALAEPRSLSGMVVLGAVWAFAIAAALAQVWSAAAPSVGMYAGFGWFCVLAAAPAAAHAGNAALACLIGSGVAYSVGTVFYANRFGWRHSHGVWHLAVVAGTALSGFAIYLLLAGTR